MVLSRHTPFVRFCIAALMALALMLNGMSRVVAATQENGAGNTIIIAGTVVTLCQFGKDAGGKDKSHLGHACDQCALRLAPLLPTVDTTPALVRFPVLLAVPSLRTSVFPEQSSRATAWPRGPPLT
jgi:hypothetical protein